MMARTTAEWLSPKKCPISCVATVCKSWLAPPAVLKFTLILKRISASSNCPTKRVLPPCPSGAPTSVATVVSVTASVPESLVKSPLQSKQTRFTPSKPDDTFEESPAREALSDMLGAASQVLNDACITSATEREPCTLELVL